VVLLQPSQSDVALSRLKNDKREKMSIKNKRLKAGWDEKYLSNLLFQDG
jgi:hypothetical protein